MGKLDRRQGALFRGANIGFIFKDFTYFKKVKDLGGDRETEFGEKASNYRLELRVG